MLSICYFAQITKNIPSFENKGQVSKINGLSIGNKEFVNDFNNYIDNLNKSNKFQNLMNAIGYSVAFLTALFSFILFK